MPGTRPVFKFCQIVLLPFQQCVMSLSHFLYCVSIDKCTQHCLHIKIITYNFNVKPWKDFQDKVYGKHYAS